MTIKAYVGVDGRVYRELIRPKSITITRAEGPSHLCDIPQHAESWTAANHILLSNAGSAPKGGGYDKHDFKVVFENGVEYTGRYDLQHREEDPCDLAGHVRQFLQWIAFDERAKTLCGATEIEDARLFLRAYDVGQGAVPLIEGEEVEITGDFREA